MFVRQFAGFPTSISGGVRGRDEARIFLARFFFFCLNKLFNAARLNVFDEISLISRTRILFSRVLFVWNRLKIMKKLQEKPLAAKSKCRNNSLIN